MERVARLQGGDDGRGEGAGVIQLLDVVLGDFPLRLVHRKDGGTVLRPAVVALAVFLGGVVGHREKQFKQGAETDPPRVVAHFHHFRVAGAAAADRFVIGAGRVAAGVAGHHRLHAVERLIDRFHAPEAAAGEHSAAGILIGGNVFHRIGEPVRVYRQGCAGDHCFHTTSVTGRRP